LLIFFILPSFVFCPPPPFKFRAWLLVIAY
jgi:hypothetical protein